MNYRYENLKYKDAGKAHVFQDARIVNYFKACKTKHFPVIKVVRVRNR